jgi:hypothetical protein
MARKYFKKSAQNPAVEEPAETGVEIVETEASPGADETPKKPHIAKRAAYGALYAVSYGAVFSSLLLRKLLVPKNSFVETALHDGAVAAQHAFEEKERLVEEVIQETEEFFSPAAPEEEPTASAA